MFEATGEGGRGNRKVWGGINKVGLQIKLLDLCVWGGKLRRESAEEEGGEGGSQLQERRCFI